MEELPYPTDLDRLQASLRQELRAQNAMRRLDLDEETLDGIAEGILSEIEYAFSVQWAPSWVHGDQPHRWAEPAGETPTAHFVECLRCKRITCHPSDAEAETWWESHRHDHA